MRARLAARWRSRPRPRPEHGWVPLRRRSPGPRRWLAAGSAAAATAAGLSVLAPEPPPGRPVVVAVHEVPAGAALQASDVELDSRPADELPVPAVHRVDEVVGRVLAAPLAAREVVTSTRLVGQGLLTGRPRDEVAAPVRIADAASAALLRAGARVDVLVAVEGARTARTVARGATVLAVGPRASGSLLAGAGDGVGGLVLLAVSDSTAADLAQSAAAGPLSVVLR